MKKMTGHEIKKTWLEFFRERGHKIEDSASLIPINDPTLLWINAGVAPLKGYFDGSKVPSNPRIANVQKCLRTNDIENVGKTARHHTFFEMLGNFSIGDYFRDEAVKWGYELLTSPKYYGFDPDKLYMTVYPTDEETYKQWLEVGVKADHIIKSYENYWEIGPGPCGPCTEIFYDRGSGFGPENLDLIRNDIENDRYIEIWNIVFSQYNAKKGLDREAYPELPKKNIDTGMGLERMACVIQETETNFETDLFYPVIEALSIIAEKPYDGSMSFKVIADHIRTVVFALSDGATFSNEGRGYVLRRLLRRAVKHGKSLGIKRAFLVDLVDEVIEMMQETYPYLIKNRAFTKTMIEKEETKFLETLNQGEKILESLLEKDVQVIEGKEAFMLYDTYGFPVELTEEYAEAKGVSVDKAGFKEHMEMQRERARAARKDSATMNDQNPEFLNFKEKSTFIGYNETETTGKVIKVFAPGIVVDRTPFYAESGGQVADQGVIIKDDKVYEVMDVQKLPNGQFLHFLDDHDLNAGDTVELKVDTVAREATKAHHSVTHLLFATLRQHLGTHVMQQGSLVGPDYLRFDFNHLSLPDEATLLEIEKLVNEKIRKAIAVDIDHTDLETAKAKGAIAEFGEKYEDEVRLVDMGETLDLCGGTHVDNTAEIEAFAIASIESKGSGIYRIVGLAKDRVYEIDDYLQGVKSNAHHLLNKKAQIMKAADEQGIDVQIDIPQEPKITGSYQDVINYRNYLKTLQSAVKQLEKTYEQKKQESSLSDIGKYLADADPNGNIITTTENMDMSTVKTLADRLMEKQKQGVVFIANITKDKVVFIAKSKSDVHAGNLVKAAAKIAGGGGGGRPDFAQAGGKDPEKVHEVLAFVKEKLS